MKTSPFHVPADLAFLAAGLAVPLVGVGGGSAAISAATWSNASRSGLAAFPKAPWVTFSELQLEAEEFFSL